MNEDRTETEAEIRGRWDAGDLDGAAALAVERYGRELLAFLVSLSGDVTTASDVFGRFSEDLWRTWARFEWRCSVRTWCYKLARRALGHHRRNAGKIAREQPLSHPSRLAVAVQHARTATAPYLRTDVKDRFQELRAQLSEEDQSLLILRVDRRLTWLELAEIMLGDEQAVSPERTKTEAARLRKRYQIAKDKLRALVEEAGLLDETGA